MYLLFARLGSLYLPCLSMCTLGYHEDVSLVRELPESSHCFTLGNAGSSRVLQGIRPAVRVKGSPWKAEVAEGMAQASSQMESVARLKFCEANKNLGGI